VEMADVNYQVLSIINRILHHAFGAYTYVNREEVFDYRACDKPCCLIIRIFD
jgi:hypothetical protein